VSVCVFTFVHVLSVVVCHVLVGSHGGGFVQNHLDLESVEWLERFLVQQNIPMVIVSHDREFLDQVCTKIVDCADGVTSTYQGNYARFLKLKAAKLEAWESAYAAQQKRIKEERAWINAAKNKPASSSMRAQREAKLDKLLKGEVLVGGCSRERVRASGCSRERCG
jgi:ATP-binding cassette, subfamily F, member 3